MILSILTPCNDDGNDTTKEGIEYESNKDMVEIIQPTKKAKRKHNEIIDELIWTQAATTIAELHQIGADSKCKDNSDMKVECPDKCTSNKQCTNKRIQNKNWKSVEKRQTENGKEYGLFVKENCKKRDLINEYVGKVIRKHNKNNCNVYFMTLIEKHLWINLANVGGLVMFINHSCDPNCQLERWEVSGLPRICFFANKEIKEGDEFDDPTRIHTLRKYVGQAEAESWDGVSQAIE
jgi:hypothetical protein